MTFTAQTSLRTRVASLGAVTAIHVGVAVALVIGLAAVRQIRPEPRVNTFDVPRDQPQPAPKPSAKPDDPQTQTHETVISPPFDFKPATFDDPRPVPQVDARPTPDSLPSAAPIAHSVFKAPAPRGRPADWATPDDYPPLDLRLEHEGLARFTLSIGADGRVTSCMITGSSGFAGLDAATCTLVSRHARFTPAQDEDGNATTGSYSNAIRWVIPR